MNNQPIVFFDGVCNLCNGFVDWLVRRDVKGVFLIASLQGKTAQEKIPNESRALLDSVVLQTPTGTLLQKSQAIFWIFRHLPWPWRALSVLQICPRVVRDWIYDQIARRRYAFFGQRLTCRRPTAEERDRFLE